MASRSRPTDPPSTFNGDAPVANPRSAHWRVAAALFVAFQLFYGLWASGRFHVMDGYASFYTTESLVERGTVSLPVEKSLFGRRAVDGSFHTPYGPLRAVAGVPGYLFGKWLGDVCESSPAQRETLLWLGTSLINTTISALAVAVFFLLVTRLGAATLPALLATLTFALATPHWHYATTYFSEPTTTLLLLTAAWLLVDLVGRQPCAQPLWELGLVSLPLALLVAERMTMAIFFPLFALTLFGLVRGGLGRRVASTAVYCATPALALAAYMAWNYARFGDVMQLGYPDSFEGDRPPDAFDEPFSRGLYGLLLSHGKGLFFFALPAIIGLLASADMIRRVGWRSLWLLVVPLIPLGFYSRFSYWEGAYSWGPRYLVPVIAFWVVPLAFWRPQKRLLKLTYPAAAVFSGTLGLLGVSVSFMECQVMRGYYLPGFRYNLDYSAIETTIAVLRPYVSAALDGRFLEGPIGMGFDRWFFLLAKSGFSTSTLTGVVVSLSVGFAGSVALLAVTVRTARRDEALCDVPISRELDSAEPIDASVALENRAGDVLEDSADRDEADRSPVPDERHVSVTAD